MLIIVDDKRQNVSFCKMSFEQFFRIQAVIQIARTLGDDHIRKLAKDLNLNCLFVLDYDRRQISLLRLSWEQVFMLNAAMISLQKAMDADKTKEALSFMITLIDATVESALRTDASLVDYAGSERDKNIHLR